MEPELWSTGTFSHLSSQELDEHRQKGAENAANWLAWRRQQNAVHSRKRSRRSAQLLDEQLSDSGPPATSIEIVPAHHGSTMKMEDDDLALNYDEAFGGSHSDVPSPASHEQDSAILEGQMAVDSGLDSPAITAAEQNTAASSPTSPATSSLSSSDEELRSRPRKKRKLAKGSTSRPAPAASRRIGRPPGLRVALFRPTVSGSFYHVPTPAEFDRMPDRDKIRYSHVGRIEQGVESEVADHPCRECRGVGRRFLCRKYTQQGARLYDGSHSSGKCGHCRWRKQPCHWDEPPINSTSKGGRDGPSSDGRAAETLLADRDSLAREDESTAGPMSEEDEGAGVVASSAPASTVPAITAPTRPGVKPGTRFAEEYIPNDTSRYYRHAIKIWQTLSRSVKVRYSHVARIEETSEGEDQDSKCVRCQQKGYAPCRKYTQAARLVHEQKATSRSHNKCARCRFDQQKCE